MNDKVGEFDDSVDKGDDNDTACDDGYGASTNGPLKWQMFLFLW